jgi:hypothetical protein
VVLADIGCSFLSECATVPFASGASREEDETTVKSRDVVFAVDA